MQLTSEAGFRNYTEDLPQARWIKYLVDGREIARLDRPIDINTGEPTEPTISWVAIGSVERDRAALMAKAIETAVDDAETINDLSDAVFTIIAHEDRLLAESENGQVLH